MSFVHTHAFEPAAAAGDTFLVVQGDRLLARPETSIAVQLPTRNDLAGWSLGAARPLRVGLLEGAACWLLAVADVAAIPPAGWLWHETRALLGVFSPAQSHAVSCARQLLWWDQRHRFCGVCGSPTVEVVEERARKCPKCSAVFFPVVSPAVIVAVTRGDELLLAHNRNFRPGMFSLLAGFVDPGETLEQAVVREVREEVGIEVDSLNYVASQPWSFPNSLMLGFRAVHRSGDLVVDGKEIEQAAWFRRDAMPEVPRPGTVAHTLIDRWLRE